AAQHGDVALTANSADAAHEALVDAQVDMNHSLFDQQIAFQQSIYYWVDQMTTADVNELLFVDPDADPASTNLFNGAFTRYSEALVVSQALRQAQWDHLLGVNQTLGAGGYEQAIADALQTDFFGTGIDPASDLGEAVAGLDDNVNSF